MPETITSRPVTIRVGTSRVVLAVSARIEPAPPPAPVIPWPSKPQQYALTQPLPPAPPPSEGERKETPRR